MAAQFQKRSFRHFSQFFKRYHKINNCGNFCSKSPFIFHLIMPLNFFYFQLKSFLFYKRLNWLVTNLDEIKKEVAELHLVLAIIFHLFFSLHELAPKTIEKSFLVLIASKRKFANGSPFLKKSYLRWEAIYKQAKTATAFHKSI